jgi:hypothetical protein
VVQPANTWSNIGYLIAAIVIFRQKNWSPIRAWIAFVVLFLFFGSTFYHMSGTYIGKDVDIAGMLLLSSFVLGQTLARTFSLSSKKTFFLTIVIFVLSLPSVSQPIVGTVVGGGGIMFVLQIVITTVLELIYTKKNPISPEIKKSLLLAVSLFFFALILNLLDMNRIYCLPENNVVTLHAIWHLICAYSIYLGAKYYCHQEPAAKLS